MNAEPATTQSVHTYGAVVGFQPDDGPQRSDSAQLRAVVRAHCAPSCTDMAAARSVAPRRVVRNFAASYNSQQAFRVFREASIYISTSPLLLCGLVVARVGGVNTPLKFQTH